jgi:hypothetical protein
MNGSTPRGRVKVEQYRGIARHAGAVTLAAMLCGCGASDMAGSLLVAPGKYEHYTCQQIADRQKVSIARKRELRGLIQKAERDAAGVVVSAFAYQTEYATARGDVRLLEETAQRKQCPAAPK